MIVTICLLEKSEASLVEIVDFASLLNADDFTILVLVAIIII